MWQLRRGQIVGRGALDAASGGGAYVGPGDIATAYAWWGLRAYSAATAGSNAVRIVRASDSAQQDFVTLANGALDVASIATFLAATTGKIVTLYDQTGGGRHLTQATDANRPAYNAAAIGSLPGAQFTAASQHTLTTPVANLLTLAQPLTTSIVYERTTSANTGLIGPNIVLEGNGADNLRSYAGSVVDVTATDSAFHAAQIVFSNASSDVYVDGTSHTGTLGTGALSGNTFTLGNDSFGAYHSGFVCEIGLWSGAFSSGVKSSMNSNQHSYWGF